MSKKKLVFTTFEELENHLRNCVHWHTTENVGNYDTVGITILLSALLDNLEQNTHESLTEDLQQILSGENISFLKSLCDNIP